MQHNKKHCPAIIGIYYYVDGISSPKEIAETLGLNTSTVWQILKRKYGIGSVRKQHDIDAIERDYLAGVSTYEMAEKYGISHQTISKWMNKRGHIRGKGHASNYCGAGAAKGRAVQLDRAIVKMKEKAAEDSGGTVEFVSWGGDKSTFKCNVCGSVFEKWRNTTIICPNCHPKPQSISAEERARLKEERQKEREIEYAKEKHCIVCGDAFHSYSPYAKYCSKRCKTHVKIQKKLERERLKTAAKQKFEFDKDNVCKGCGGIFHSKYEHKEYCETCQARAAGSDHRVRAKKYRVSYESGITLKKLVERDGNICQICGEPCDADDMTYGSFGPLYPSIDHIVPMAKGGPHTWGNVQLAHVICNSKKRDNYDAEEHTA